MIPQSLPEFVVPFVVTASFATVGAIAVWGIRTIRHIEVEVMPRVERKLDRVLAVLYGPPESKEADGLVKDFRDIRSLTDHHETVLRMHGRTIEEIDRLATQTARTCAVTHPDRKGVSR